MKKRSSSAFTLIEMLVVMGIMVVMITLITPVAVQALRGSNMSQSGELVGDQLVLARQAAMTSNRPVQVRFYQLPVPGAGTSVNYAGIQTFRVEENGVLTPLTKLQALRTSVIFAPSLMYSTLIAQPGTPSVTGMTTLPAYNNQVCPYVGFQFLPNGSTDLDPTAAAGWFVTLVDANLPIPTTGQPKNFFTVRVEALNGHTQSFRP